MERMRDLWIVQSCLSACRLACWHDHARHAQRQPIMLRPRDRRFLCAHARNMAAVFCIARSISQDMHVTHNLESVQNG